MDSEIQKVKEKILPTLKEAGVLRSALFGSLARGEPNPGDVDVLVEFPSGKTLLDFVGLKEDLERVLRARVDLVTYRSLSRFLRERVMKEAIQIL